MVDFIKIIINLMIGFININPIIFEQSKVPFNINPIIFKQSKVPFNIIRLIINFKLFLIAITVITNISIKVKIIIS